MMKWIVSVGEEPGDLHFCASEDDAKSVLKLFMDKFVADHGGHAPALDHLWIAEIKHGVYMAPFSGNLVIVSV